MNYAAIHFLPAVTGGWRHENLPNNPQRVGNLLLPQGKATILFTSRFCGGGLGGGRLPSTAWVEFKEQGDAPSPPPGPALPNPPIRGATTVTFLNGSRYDPLYIYRADAPQGAVINCNTMAKYLVRFRKTRHGAQRFLPASNPIFGFSEWWTTAAICVTTSLRTPRLVCLAGLSECSVIVHRSQIIRTAR
jgi:hypothetical protein